MPKISIILTSYNHAKYIRESIDSVLAQTFADFELLVLDDASSDNSWDIINSYTDPRIKAYRNENNQLGTKRFNQAITEIAAGEYIAVHHSDDVWELDKLHKQVEFLDSHPQYGAIFTNAFAIGEDSKPLNDPAHFYSSIFDQHNRSRYEWLNHFFYEGNALCHPSILVRKHCYMNCGVYRYGLAQLTDFDMWIRLCLKYEIYVLPERLVRFRVRENEANASGRRPEARIRAATELHYVLRNFLEIDSFEEMEAIFPDAKAYYRADGFEKRFVLAMVTLGDKSLRWSRLFGIELLFDLIGDQRTAEKIKSLYNFDHLDLIKITGKYDVFSIDAAEAAVKLDQVLSSNSWKIGAPLRWVGGFFARLTGKKI